jgi:putative transposase
MNGPIRKRCVRFNEPGQAHELTFSCHQRLPLLSRDRTRVWLCDAIEEARRLLEFDLWAYVFMPEHVHLLIWPRRPHYQISSILWRIKRPVGRKAIDFLARHGTTWLPKLRVTGPGGRTEYRFWQAGGGYDRNLTEPDTVRQVVDYIHANPVRRGLAERPEDWPWSSAGHYAGRPFRKLLVDGTMTDAIGP